MAGRNGLAVSYENDPNTSHIEIKTIRVGSLLDLHFS